MSEPVAGISAAPSEDNLVRGTKCGGRQGPVGGAAQPPPRLLFPNDAWAACVGGSIRGDASQWIIGSEQHALLLRFMSMPPPSCPCFDFVQRYFNVIILGPVDSPYQGGCVWCVSACALIECTDMCGRRPTRTPPFLKPVPLNPCSLAPPPATPAVSCSRRHV